MPLGEVESPTARALRTFVVLIIVGLLAYVTSNLWSTKLDTARFVADSIAHESDHAMLLQMNKRITDIWCGQVPANEQRACR